MIGKILNVVESNGYLCFNIIPDDETLDPIPRNFELTGRGLAHLKRDLTVLFGLPKAMKLIRSINSETGALEIAEASEGLQIEFSTVEKRGKLMISEILGVL